MATARGGNRAQAALQRIYGRVSAARRVRVGFLENAKYPDGTPVAMIAAIHNFGAPRAGIPPRPFFTNMILAKKAEWPKAMGDLLIANDFHVYPALRLTGEAIAGQLRESIVKTNAPPLKPETIVRKGGTRDMKYNPGDPKTFAAKPLVHTGHMLNSVDYEVT